MSSELKKYLLSGARDVPHARPSPFESNNLALALRRHAHAYASSQNKPTNARNRLSLDLDSKYGPVLSSGYLDGSLYQAGVGSGGSGAHQVRYRGAVSDLSNIANRRSLDLDALLNPNSAARRRTVTFHLPEGVDPSTVGTNGVNYVTQYHFGDGDDQLAEENDNQERISRSRRRRREDQLARDDSVEIENPDNPEHTGVSPQLAKLVEITPKSYAEAQRLKKMLKRAVSGPNATFEDLKLYRTTMKRLRRIVKQEQEREIEIASEEAREQQLQHELEKVCAVWFTGFCWSNQNKM